MAMPVSRCGGFARARASLSILHPSRARARRATTTRADVEDDPNSIRRRAIRRLARVADAAALALALALAGIVVERTTAREGTAARERARVRVGTFRDCVN